jgi:chitin synthase
MEDKSFGLKNIHVVNVILEYFYLGLLMMCFILSLGNRPQGSKYGYTTAFIGFAIITIYMTVCLLWCSRLVLSLIDGMQFAAFFLAFKGVENIAKVQGRPVALGDVFSNSIFRNIVLSLLATLGLYLISSVIFVSCIQGFDGRHTY